MGRPPSDLDDYLAWQDRLESFQASGLDIGAFCVREVSVPGTTSSVPGA